MRQLLLWLVLALFLAPTVLLTDPNGFRFAVAMADDDDDDDGGDDDDDDDDDDGRRRGDRRGPKLPRLFAPAPRVATPAPIAAANEIVVAAVTADELSRIVADGFLLIGSAPLSLIDGIIARVRPPGGLGIDAAEERIRVIAPSAIVDANHLYRPVEMPCRQDDCLAFEMIGWAVPPLRCEIGETIGMIDTAVNAEHEALRTQAVEVLSVMSDGERNSAAVHGTAIAALLVGNHDSRTPGLLPEGRLVAVEAFHRDRGGDAADVYKIVRALDLLRVRGIRIVNLSFAGPANLLIERAVAEATAGGMVLVAAAGNRGPNALPAHPAAYSGVVAVTAIDRARRPYRQAGRGDHIAFSAPGVGIWTAASVSGGRFRSGTSYAAPFVSAAIAASLARQPGQTGADLVKGLAARSVDLGDAGRDAVFGWGLVNANGC